MQPARRVAGVAVVKPVDVGQQHQQRRLDQVGDDRRQPVVVAEGGLQLLDADGVVLVDDRHGPQVDEREDRVACVQITHAVIEVCGGEQDLGRMVAVVPQRPLVGFDQEALPDGGHGLKMGKIGGPALQPQPSHAGPDRPGANQGHLPARGDHLVDLLGELRDLLFVEFPSSTG